MRFLLKLIALLLIIAIAGTWFFLPKTITVTSTINMGAPSVRIFTFLENEKEWKKWWPGKTEANSPLIYQGYHYKLGRTSENIAETIVSREDKQFTGNILIAGGSTDSSMVQWTMPFYSGNNLYKKLRYYFIAKSLKQDMETILDSLNAFVSQQENIYGMEIKRERVKDTVLVATRAVFPHYPTTEEIYSMVKKLKDYIASEKATETNVPMLHVVNVDSSYETMVGIPTNHALKGNNTIKLKRMVPGYILHGDVKGGTYTILNGFRQLENYRYDKRLASPAIPFALLITDRSIEPDTSKWVTGLYYPVF